MRRWIVIAGIFVVIVVFLIWRSSDKQVVQRKTEGFLQVMTMGEDVGGGGRKLQVYKLSNLLAESISISAPFIGKSERHVYRDEFEQAYRYLCDQAQVTHFEVMGKKAVEINEDSAMVSCVISGLVKMADVSRVDGEFHVTFYWRMVDDQWRLEKMVWEEVG